MEDKAAVFKGFEEAFKNLMDCIAAIPTDGWNHTAFQRMGYACKDLDSGFLWAREAIFSKSDQILSDSENQVVQ